MRIKSDKGSKLWLVALADTDQPPLEADNYLDINTDNPREVRWLQRVIFLGLQKWRDEEGVPQKDLDRAITRAV